MVRAFVYLPTILHRCREVITDICLKWRPDGRLRTPGGNINNSALSDIDRGVRSLLSLCLRFSRRGSFPIIRRDQKRATMDRGPARSLQLNGAPVTEDEHPARLPRRLRRRAILLAT